MHLFDWDPLFWISKNIFGIHYFGFPKIMRKRRKKNNSMTLKCGQLQHHRSHFSRRGTNSNHTTKFVSPHHIPTIMSDIEERASLLPQSKSEGTSLNQRRTASTLAKVAVACCKYNPFVPSLVFMLHKYFFT